MNTRLIRRLLIACALFTLSASAYCIKPDYRYGIEAGWNGSDMRYAIDGQQSGKMGARNGYRVGVSSEMILWPFLELGSGLYISNVGANDNEYYHNSYSATYLELPLLVRGTLPLAPWLSASIEGGCYAAIGIGGKTRTGIGTEAFFGSNGVAHPLDFGPMLGVSALFADNYRVALRARYGVVDISNGRLQNKASLYNEAISISLSYVF